MIEFLPSRTGAAAPPALKDGEVHLWSAWLDGDAALLAGLEGTLSSDERARAERIRIEAQRRRFVVARGLLRKILAGYVASSPGRLRFRYGEWGKPSLDQDGAVRFGVSHSGELLLIGVHRSLDPGVDVERLRPIPNRERLAKRFFTPREHRSLLELPEDLRDLAFLTCWTRKEACAKTSGGPLIPQLERFEFRVEPGQPARLALLEGDPAAAGRWFLEDLAPAPGYLGALAVEGSIKRVVAGWWPGGSAGDGD